MSPASHIFEWAHNSQPIYRAMVDLQRRSQPDARDCYLSEVGRAAAAFNIACRSHGEMVNGGEITRDEYSAKDILDASLLVLGWGGPE